MPVSWEIRGPLLIVRLVGRYAFDEPEAAIVEAMSCPEFQTDTSLLIDARSSEIQRSSEEFRQRSVWMASLQPRGLSSRCAIVISDRPSQFGMARMAATHLELRGMTLGIFTDLDEAVKWLSNGGEFHASAAGAR